LAAVAGFLTEFKEAVSPPVYVDSDLIFDSMNSIYGLLRQSFNICFALFFQPFTQLLYSTYSVRSFWEEIFC
jgi:hypothetical protein